MNTITITFDHPKAEEPKYKFGDRVAVAGNYQLDQWSTGKVVGLYLEEALVPQWFYAVQLDSPHGFVEEYPGDDLVFESDISHMQAGWDVASEPEELVVDCDRCEGTGYVVDSWTFQSDACSSCAGTGIKGYAKRLPPASLREERAE